MADQHRLNAGFMAVDAGYEVQRTNNFRIAFEFDNTASSSSTGNSGNPLTSDDAYYLELACDSTGLPTTTNSPIELAYGNSKVKVAGQAEVDDISVTVKDFIDKDIEGILWAWRTMVYDPKTGGVGWAKAYKKNATIYQYGPNGQVERAWRLIGVWPTSLDLGEMSYDGGDKKSVTMNLSVDDAYRVDGNLEYQRGKIDVTSVGSNYKAFDMPDKFKEAF